MSQKKLQRQAAHGEDVTEGHIHEKTGLLDTDVSHWEPRRKHHGKPSVIGLTLRLAAAALTAVAVAGCDVGERYEKYRSKALGIKTPAAVDSGIPEIKAKPAFTFPQINDGEVAAIHHIPNPNMLRRGPGFVKKNMPTTTNFNTTSSSSYYSDNICGYPVASHSRYRYATKSGGYTLIPTEGRTTPVPPGSVAGKPIYILGTDLRPGDRIGLVSQTGNLPDEITLPAGTRIYKSDGTFEGTLGAKEVDSTGTQKIRLKGRYAELTQEGLANFQALQLNPGQSLVLTGPRQLTVHCDELSSVVQELRNPAAGAKPAGDERKSGKEIPKSPKPASPEPALPKTVTGVKKPASSDLREPPKARNNFDERLGDRFLETVLDKGQYSMADKAIEYYGKHLAALRVEEDEARKLNPSYWHPEMLGALRKQIRALLVRDLILRDFKPRNEVLDKSGKPIEPESDYMNQVRILSEELNERQKKTRPLVRQVVDNVDGMVSRAISSAKPEHFDATASKKTDRKFEDLEKLTPQQKYDEYLEQQRSGRFRKGPRQLFP